MRKFLEVINVLFNVLADLLYAPLVRAYLKEIAIKAPLFPGQLWILPGVGEVGILRTDIYSVTYTLLEDDNEEIYICSRSEFVIHSRSVAESPVRSEEDSKLKLLQFPQQDNKKSNLK